jgi:septal ring factor EnvC (AmiA/AmiB activator)
MKYKSFSILFLAVSLVFGHITFSDGENNTQSASASWWLRNMPEAVILNDVSSVQSDIYELAYSENRFADLENTFQESRQLLGKNREELEAYITKIETMQADIQSNIEKSTEEKQQLEDNISALQREIIRMKEKQEETKNYIRKIFVDNYMASSRDKTDVSLYGALFQSTFGLDISQRDGL